MGCLRRIKHLTALRFLRSAVFSKIRKFNIKMNVTKETPAICWWSGGIASAVACKIAIDTWGVAACRVIMIDTGNEHEDTYRFLNDCRAWYGCEIETITAVGRGEEYDSIKGVWYKYLSLNVANGAICSSELKRAVRLKFQRRTKYACQVFGFDDSEAKRGRNMKKNYPAAKPVFPLLMFMYSKLDCMRIVKNAGIAPPVAYELGFRNNNCLQTGCVQGGMGYWQKMQREFPDKFREMARVEHEITDLKGEAVTILRSQTKEAKLSGIQKVFLLPHPDYPQHKSLKDMPPQKVKPIGECNGFCGMQAKLF